MKNLPIGISTLRSILKEDMVYIDKTEYAWNLVKTMGRYFLSRPRRFGKSLFLDTLKEIFEGNEELFRGLNIHNKWDWSRKYPVIKIDFVAGLITDSESLHVRLVDILGRNAKNLGIHLNINTDPAGMLNGLIDQCLEKYKMPAVILVDEYDKPLLDNIEAPERAKEIRDALKGLYAVIKDRDAELYFVFLTGVSKFSKVSIFSGINNLKDITLSADYAAICGYTQHDLEISFAEHLEGVDREKLRLWYNGYNFMGEPVYNPFDILLFISEHGLYKNYWFETGTPTFLVKLFQQKQYFLPNLDAIEAGEELLSSFEIENIEPVTLLFQSGYLTIKETMVRREKIIYALGFPNREVRLAFNDYLISSYTGITDKKLFFQDHVYNALKQGDLTALESAIKRLFAGIPWRNFTNNDIADYEGYYASVLYAFFSAINCEVIPEDISNYGQADMTIKLYNFIYVMEVKVVGDTLSDASKNSALEQIIERDYAAKYTGVPGVRVFEAGMVFSQKERNCIAFDARQR